MSAALGVDIGGTKIQFCRIEADWSVVPLGRTPTALLRRGTTKFADDLLRLVRSQLSPTMERVAVSLNGVLDRGRVPYSSLMGGRVEFPLQDYLQQGLDQRVAVDDDIHAMTIAEAALGGQPPGPFAVLNLGTGIGVGFHDGERVLRGRYAAGLISEQVIFVETLAQFRSLDRTVCGRGLREMYRDRTGLDADAVTIFARARGRETGAEDTVGVFARHLGLAMQMISRFYHPHRIVINGSIRHAADVFLAQAVDVYRTGLEPAFQAEIGVSTLDHSAELGVLLGAGATRS